MTRIIGINGFKRTGKGETAAALERIAPFSVQTLGFADKVKVFAALCLGFSRDRSDEELIALMDEAKEQWIIDITDQITPDNINAVRPQGPFHDLTGREYLQHVGTRARQMFGDDFWVDQVLPRPVIGRPHDIAPVVNDNNVGFRYPGVDLVAFSDLRFENEAERVLALGGEVWEIVRPGTESDGHDSEQVLPRELVTVTIVNDGTLDELEEKVAVELANCVAGHRA